MKHVSIAIAILVAGILPLNAQPCAPQFTLSSTGTANTSTSGGMMFDMQPTGGGVLRIESFNVFVGTGAQTVQVWVRQPLQSYDGFHNTMTGWTMVGQAAITGSAGTTAVPLNLCMGHNLLPGGRTGFYITTNPAASYYYVAGTAVGNVAWSDANLSVYEGNTGPLFNCTISPRKFMGAVRYSYGENLLALSQSGPGIGDLQVTLGNIKPTAYDGWTLLTTQTAQPVATGPILGIWPENLTWDIIAMPYFPGNPFHFNATDAGFFPQAPFYAPPGSVSGLAGVTMDAVCLLRDITGGYDSRSNVARITFQ